MNLKNHRPKTGMEVLQGQISSKNIMAIINIKNYIFILLMILNLMSIQALANTELTQIGITISVRNDAEADNKTINEIRKIIRKSELYVGDVINTKGKSSTKLLFVDGSIISMRAGSELIVDDYKFDQKAKEGKLAANLISGGFKIVTGKIAKYNNKQFKINSPIGSIGVRGTIFSTELRIHYEKISDCMGKGGSAKDCLLKHTEQDIKVSVGIISFTDINGNETIVSYSDNKPAISVTGDGKVVRMTAEEYDQKCD